MQPDPLDERRAGVDDREPDVRPPLGDPRGGHLAGVAGAENGHVGGRHVVSSERRDEAGVGGVTGVVPESPGSGHDVR
jgi:hypothetical protein